MKELLQRKGVSGYRLAKDAGLSQSIVAQWVTGDKDPRAMKLETAARVAKALGMSIDELWKALN